MKAIERRRWFWFAVLIGIIGASAVRELRSTADVQVTTAPVTAGTIARHILAVGTVQGVTTVEVGSQASGIVQTVDVDFNSIVHAGQVMARLDPSLLQASYDQARAALQESQGALLQAQTDLTGLSTAESDARIKLERAERLASQGLIQQADLDAAHIAMDEASADVRSGEARITQADGGVDRARGAVDQAAADLDHTIIRSPIDGIVIERDVDVGQTLAAAVQAPVLFRIAADLARMQVQVEVDEADIGGVKPGDAATFTVESYPDETFKGTVTSVRLQPVAEQTTTAATVATAIAPPSQNVVATVVGYMTIVDVANPDEKLRPGMTAEVTLAGSRRDHTIRLPNSALSFRPSPDVLIAAGEAGSSSAASTARAGDADRETRQVWQYDGKRFRPIAVRVGLSNDQWTELLGGPLHPGDAVVTNAVLKLHSRI
jgi:HlyD family secretion protein